MRITRKSDCWSHVQLTQEWSITKIALAVSYLTNTYLIIYTMANI